MTHIYLNNAGAGLPSQSTVDAQVAHLYREREIGPMQAAAEAQQGVAEFYSLAADLLGCASDEIAYADSASRAWNAVLCGVDLAPEDEVVTLSTEFGTNLVSLFHHATRAGARVKIVECEPDGSFSLDRLTNSLNSKTRLVALSHVAAHASMTNPVDEIGQIIRETTDACYLVDGCQAVGQAHVNVQEIGCDAHVGVGRKWLRGPRGTAFLFARQGTTKVRTPFVDLASADLIFDEKLDVTGVSVRGDAKQFELWERSIANMLGLPTALREYLNLDRSVAHRRIYDNAEAIAKAAQTVPGIRSLEAGERESGIAGLTGDLAALDVVQTALDSAGVIYSTLAEWDAPIHFRKLGIERILRISPHYFTSETEIDTVVDLLDSMSSKL